MSVNSDRHLTFAEKDAVSQLTLPRLLRPKSIKEVIRERGSRARPKPESRIKEELKCDLCKITFVIKGDLRRHQRTKMHKKALAEKQQEEPKNENIVNLKHADMCNKVEGRTCLGDMTNFAIRCTDANVTVDPCSRSFTVQADSTRHFNRFYATITDEKLHYIYL